MPPPTPPPHNNVPASQGGATPHLTSTTSETGSPDPVPDPPAPVHVETSPEFEKFGVEMPDSPTPPHQKPTPPTPRSTPNGEHHGGLRPKPKVLAPEASELSFLDWLTQLPASLDSGNELAELAHFARLYGVSLPIRKGGSASPKQTFSDWQALINDVTKTRRINAHTPMPPDTRLAATLTAQLVRAQAVWQVERLQSRRAKTSSRAASAEPDSQAQPQKPVSSTPNQTQNGTLQHSTPEPSECCLGDHSGDHRDHTRLTRLSDPAQPRPSESRPVPPGTGF